MSAWRRAILIPLVLCALGATASASCRSDGPTGEVPNRTAASPTDAGLQTQRRPVSGFDRVHVSGVGLLVITPGAPDALSVEAEPDLLSRIRSRVEDGQLEIGPAPGSGLSSRRPIVYRLTASNLRGLWLSGAAGARAAGLRGDDLTLEVDGRGRASLTDLRLSHLSVVLSGAGRATLTGAATRQEITITGAGRYQGEGLESRQATVSLTGAGLCRLRVSDRLDVDLTGTGRVSYLGSPDLHQTVLGTGLVTRAG